MAMSFGGGSRRVQPSMNVTPLVDVVLVLLIIFMVVTPLMVRRLWLNVPKRAEAQAAVSPPAPPLTLVVRKDGRAELDKQLIDDAALTRSLGETFRAQPERALFFRAEGEVLYGRAMDVLDLAKGAGAHAIAVVPDEVASR